MATILGHTTRASGTILTAAIYNADHTTHITNANALNAAKLEGGTPPVVDGQAVVWNGTTASAFKSAGYVPADAARLIATGTGLLGGGSLAADRTLTPDIASQAEAEAGSSSAKLMTPQRVLQCINANVPLPIGSAFPYLGGSIPAKYIAANGANVSRSTYAALFAVCGTTYGAGDGSTTFGVPNGTRLMTRFDAGASLISGFTARGNTAGAQSTTIAAHTHTDGTFFVGDASGFFGVDAGTAGSIKNAATGSAGGSTPSVLQPIVATEYLIFAGV
jgi:microcystin-dependent protein